MRKKKLNLDRIFQLEAQLLKIIDDSRRGRITPELAKIMSEPLKRELGGS